MAPEEINCATEAICFSEISQLLPSSNVLNKLFACFGCSTSHRKPAKVTWGGLEALGATAAGATW